MSMYTISPAPHIKSKDSTNRIMWFVVAAILPTAIAGVWIFGPHAAWLILASVAAAVLTEAALGRLMKKPVTVTDGSAVITGLLLACNLPAGAPVWIAVLGSFFAIAIVKCAFGGLGKNIFNPALAGRAFLMLSWPAHMTTWQNPRFWPDVVSSATPLAKNAVEIMGPGSKPSLWDMFIGNRGGCIGEVCVIAILVGAGFLLYKGYIKWYTPIVYILTVGILSRLAGGSFIFSILAGGLMFGAFFMATDMVTTPLTPGGQALFGLGCGIITFAIRKWGGYPEGVSYSILIMNAATPMIDRFTKRRVFGKKKR